jgi:hypothetical protein
VDTCPGVCIEMQNWTNRKKKYLTFHVTLIMAWGACYFVQQFVAAIILVFKQICSINVTSFFHTKKKKTKKIHI